MNTKKKMTGAFLFGIPIGTLGVGSIIGAWIGGLLIYYLSGDLLKAILGIIFIISPIKIFKKIK